MSSQVARGSRSSVLVAQTVLLALTFIHLILPLTPVNTHPELRIRVVAVFLGLVFFVLFGLSFRAPRAAFGGGLTLFVLVSIVAAVSGASPATEGLGVKLLCAGGLGWGTLAALRSYAATR